MSLVSYQFDCNATLALRFDCYFTVLMNLSIHYEFNVAIGQTTIMNKFQARNPRGHGTCCLMLAGWGAYTQGYPHHGNEPQRCTGLTPPAPRC
jgi:hypothetical protein